MREFFLLLLALFLALTLFIPVLIINSIIILFKGKSLKEYFLISAIGIDQAFGSILYKQPDWTVSSWTYIQSYKHKEHKIFMKVIDFFFGKNHCFLSYMHESNYHKELYK
jgi:hypothetical protein